MNGENEMNKTTGAAPEKLPALPDKDIFSHEFGDWIGYSDDAMRAYALQAIAEAAPLAEGREEAVETLREVRALLMRTKELQGREHVSLGIAFNKAIDYFAKPATPTAQRVAAGDGPDSHAFKNFHRALCERFGYPHDEIDWRRDQVSLIEHIAASPPRGEAVGVVDGVGRGNEISTRAKLFKPLPTGTKLYTHPAAQADAREHEEKVAEVLFADGLYPDEARIADAARRIVAALAAPVAVGGA